MARKAKKRAVRWQVRCGAKGRTVSRHYTKAAAQKAARRKRGCRVSQVRTYTRTSKRRKSYRSRVRSRTRTTTAAPQWLFNWVGGGYNTVNARTRAEAVRKVHAFTKRVNATPGKKIKPDMRTLHLPKPGEVESWDRMTR